jgi:hypothetical protein
VFPWTVNGRQHNIILLTPPDQVAVQRVDSSWYRRLRTPEDGPIPYTQNWYHRYLLLNDLPSWFLTPTHAALLSDTAEAQWLQVTDTPSPRAQPEPGYLDRRYSEPPQYLLPGIRGANQIYSAELNESLIKRMARRFPAVVANASTFNNYRVYVLPSGHITIRYRLDRVPGSNEPPVQQSQLPWVPEAGEAYLASYNIEGRRVARPASSNQNRMAESDIARGDGGWVDQEGPLRGLGRLEWLNAARDQAIARNLGYETPERVLEARRNGDLTNVPTNNRPITVWWPETRYLNPQTQPEGTGHWEYITDESEREAHTNFGGQDDFPDIPNPTATDIWRLRSRLLRNGEEDRTAGVDLVWCPTGDPPSRDPTSSESEEIDPDVVDTKSGLRHQPRNREENIQTGVEGERKYQTIIINGKLYTVDRSRAHANKIQEWKSWAVTKKGVWYQWKGYSTIDWSTPGSVEKLNKWREQALGRAGFPRKREDDRPPYTEAERRWLFEYVKKFKGGRPDISMAELSRRFNQHFGEPHRDTLGIQSVYDRLRKEYEKYGTLKPTRGKTGRRPSQPQPPTTTPTDPTPSDSNDDEDDYLIGGNDSTFDEDDFEE